jgi:hypothetical protein
MLPSQDPNADVLRNKNISASDEQLMDQVDINGNPVGSKTDQNGGQLQDEDPELDELINNMTEEDFKKLNEEDQQFILDYMKRKEAK